MVKRPIMTSVCTVLLLLLTTVPALAGGWAIVVLDEVPKSLPAGEAVSLGFTIRQHGIHPVNLEDVWLTATGPSGEAIRFPARQSGEVGHYVVDVTLPDAGEWAWQIHPGWFHETDLAPVAVVGESRSTSSPLTPSLSQLVTRIGTLVMNWFMGMDPLLGTTVQPAVAQSPSAAPSATTDVVAYGRAVFIAKGCNTCHLHDAALNTWSVEAGPELTANRLPADYLRIWLKDPQELKPQTAMPNLELTYDEIEALIAFLPSSTQ